MGSVSSPFARSLCTPGRSFWRPGADRFPSRGVTGLGYSLASSTRPSRDGHRSGTRAARCLTTRCFTSTLSGLSQERRVDHRGEESPASTAGRGVCSGPTSASVGQWSWTRAASGALGAGAKRSRRPSTATCCLVTTLEQVREWFMEQMRGQSPRRSLVKTLDATASPAIR